MPVFRNDGLLARMLEKEDVPDFVRNRPVVLVAPLIQSIFIHVLVGNELIGSPREYISDYFDFILSKNAREEHVHDVRLPGEDALTSGPQASFGAGRKAARRSFLTQSKSPAAA